MSKKRNMLLAAAAAIAILGITASPALASTAEQDNQLAEVHENFIELGIDEGTADDLVEKLQNGELLDSQKSDTEPVTIVEEHESVRSVYQDGSVRITSTVVEPKTSGGIGLFATGISSCVKAGSGGGWVSYNNCYVYTNDGVTELHFYSGYTRASGSASVHGWGSAGASTLYGSVTAASFTYTKTSYSAGSPAQVQAHTRYKQYNSNTSEDIYLNLYVTPTAATVGH